MEKKNWNPIGKKHDWIQRNRGDLIYELFVWDSGKKIDRFIFNTGKKLKEILELLRLKYGINYK